MGERSASKKKGITMAMRDTFSIGVLLVLTSALQGEEPPHRATGMFDGIVMAGRRAGEPNVAIFRMNVDGSRLTRVWELPKDSYGLDQRISPQGNKLALRIGEKDKAADVWIVSSDGTHEKLVEDAIPVAWSADGQRIACFRQKESSTRNFIIDVRTKAQEELPLKDSEMVRDWSPASELLCVTALHPDKTFEHPTLGTYPLREVFLLGVSGTPRVQLRNDPLHDDMWGRFSPDGGQVSFQRRRHSEGEVFHEVVVQGRDGKHPRKVLSFEEFKGDWRTFRPTGPACWSRDGKQLATLVIRSGDNGLSFELLIVTLETGKVRRLDLNERGVDVVWIDWH